MEVENAFRTFTQKDIKDFRKLQGGRDDIFVQVALDDGPVTMKMSQLDNSFGGYEIAENNGDSIMPLLKNIS